MDRKREGAEGAAWGNICSCKHVRLRGMLRALSGVNHRNRKGPYSYRGRLGRMLVA
jgi:hypothetical protein